MKKFTSIKACVLASYLLSSIAPAYAVGETVTTPVKNAVSAITSDLSYTAKASLTTLFALSLFRFLSREPDRNPVRVTFQQFVDKVKAGELSFDDFVAFVDDSVIGHAGKRPSLRVDPETGKIDASVATYPKGLYGELNEYVKPAFKTLAFMAVTQNILKNWNAPYNPKDNGGSGISEWKNFVNAAWYNYFLSMLSFS